MPIVSADIHQRLSGGALNSDPHASLGGIKSSTQIVDNTFENLFRNVPGDESAVGSTKYRGVYVHNDHGTLTLKSTKIWFEAQTSSPDTSVEMALAGEGLNATMETIADEDTAPVGEVFSAPANKAAGLLMGDIPPGQHFGWWCKRIVNIGAAAFAADTFVVKVEGDTDA